MTINAISLESVMPPTKYERLKSKGSVIRDNFKFLEYRTEQVNIFKQQNIFYTIFATIKALKQLLNWPVSCF